VEQGWEQTGSYMIKYEGKLCWSYQWQCNDKWHSETM